MKIITITDNSIAINPRDVVIFGTNQIFESGVDNFTEANLHRMIELKFAKEISDEESEKVKLDSYDFESFTNKDELAEYAKEIYEVDLDKRKSLENMINDLKNNI